MYCAMKFFKKALSLAQLRYASDDEIHACLSLPHSPVAPGLSAAASAAALKAWVVAQFHAEHAKAEVVPGSATFHQLNWSELARASVQNRYVFSITKVLPTRRFLSFQVRNCFSDKLK
jgi:hypothetical protein